MPALMEEKNPEDEQLKVKKIECEAWEQAYEGSALWSRQERLPPLQQENVDPKDMSKMYNNSQTEMVATWRG